MLAVGEHPEPISWRAKGAFNEIENWIGLSLNFLELYKVCRRSENDCFAQAPKGRSIMDTERLHLLHEKKLEVTLLRLCHQLIENHQDFKDSAILAIQPRGVYLGRRIHELLKQLAPETEIPYGELDVTFYRDDFRRQNQPLKASKTRVDFVVEGKRIILIDDVLYTGRTVRAAMDAMLAFGRPDEVELLTLVDRKRMREVPIEAEYVGIEVDTLDSEKVIVRLKEGGGEDSVRIESK